MKKEIYCMAKAKPEKEFDKIGMDKLQEMIGWINYDTENKEWDVNMADGSQFGCKTQTEAEIMANTEEIKAMLMLLLKRKK